MKWFILYALGHHQMTATGDLVNALDWFYCFVAQTHPT